MFEPAERIVVTKEVSKPPQKRGKTKVPDACNTLGIRWMTDFAMYKTRIFERYRLMYY